MTRKLRKRPDGLSYKEVFSLNEANDDAASKAALAGDAVNSNTSDSKPVPLRSVETERDAAVEPDRTDGPTVTTTDEIASEKDVPAGIEATMPSEGDGELQEKASNPERAARQQAEMPDDPAPVVPQKRPPETSSAGKLASEPAPSPNKIRLKGYISLPAFGVSDSFDAIHDAYGLKVAEKHFLDAAIKGFVEAVRAGKAPDRVVRPDYQTMPNKIQATRHVPLDAVERVREKIDPMGILKPGSFGSSFLESAMVWHLKNDGKNEKS